MESHSPDPKRIKLDVNIPDQPAKFENLPPPPTGLEFEMMKKDKGKGKEVLDEQEPIDENDNAMKSPARRGVKRALQITPLRLRHQPSLESTIPSEPHSPVESVISTYSLRYGKPLRADSSVIRALDNAGFEGDDEDGEGPGDGMDDGVAEASGSGGGGGGSGGAGETKVEEIQEAVQSRGLKRKVDNLEEPDSNEEVIEDVPNFAFAEEEDEVGKVLVAKRKAEEELIKETIKKAKLV